MVHLSRMRLVEIHEDGSPGEAGPAVPSAGVEALAATAFLYQRVGYCPPWIGYLAVVDQAAVGTCAFTGKPADHRVEIAYFTFPGHEGHGVATQMARALVALAREASSEVLLTAHTLPRANASTRILGKLGFVCMGPVEHPEDGTVWQWHLPPGADGAAHQAGAAPATGTADG